jgi:hypothetical protein
MSREEAAAKAICEWDQQYQWGSLGDESPMKALYEYGATEVLDAADAHDLAHGVHRLTIGDATVERAARAAWPDIFEQGLLHEQNITKRLARALLSAAVQEES